MASASRRSARNPVVILSITAVVLVVVLGGGYVAWKIIKQRKIQRALVDGNAAFDRASQRMAVKKSVTASAAPSRPARAAVVGFETAMRRSPWGVSSMRARGATWKKPPPRPPTASQCRRVEPRRHTPFSKNGPVAQLVRAGDS